MKKIKVNEKTYALVDDDVFKELNQYKWSSSCGYARRLTQDPETKKVVNCFIHTEVMGKREGFQIDHINRNRLDNRRENLRFVTMSQNRMNAGPRKDSKTGYKGVGYIEKNAYKKWKVTIVDAESSKTKRKMVFVGYFHTAKEAALAYNKKAFELNGEYAYMNKI